jgi:predicted nucleic acid-binding protein
VTVVVDASVAFKCLFAEPDSRTALQLMNTQDCLAPDFLFLELRNAILTKLRGAKLSKLATIRLENDLQQLPVVPMGTIGLLHDAFSTAIELSHPIYDCLYLAAAIQLDQPLVTADRRFLAALKGSRHAGHAIALMDYPLP